MIAKARKDDEDYQEGSSEREKGLKRQAAAKEREREVGGEVDVLTTVNRWRGYRNLPRIKSKVEAERLYAEMQKEIVRTGAIEKRGVQ